jgi:hypothetical protein
VGRTIDFDDEPGFPAEEVHDIGTDQCLADELEILSLRPGSTARRREAVEASARPKAPRVQFLMGLEGEL